MTDFRTITIKEDTKARFDRVKRNGLSQDAFMNDLLDEWEDND